MLQFISDNSMKINREKLFLIDKNRLYIAILIIFVTGYIFYLYSFLKMDHSSPGGDDMHHMRFVYDYYFNLKTHGIMTYLFKPVTFYPPFAYYISTPFLLIFGHSMQTAVLSQSFFLFLLVISVFFLGKAVKDEDTGFLSALAVITIPLVGQYSHKFYLDIPTMAVTAFTALSLLKSEKYSDTLWTFLFFAASALGIMTKLQFALYLAAPVIIVTVMFLRDLYRGTVLKENILNTLYLLSVPVSAFLAYFLKRSMMDRFESQIITFVMHIAMRWSFVGELEKPGAYELNALKWYLISLIPLIVALVIVSIFKPGNRSLGNFVRGSLISIIMSWHFYGIYFKRILDFSASLQGGAGVTQNLTDFLKLASGAMGSILFMFLVVGVCSFLFFKNRSIESNIVFASLILTMILIYLFPRKEDRWFMPVVIYAAPIAAYWFLSIKWKCLRWSFFAIFIYFSVMNPYGWIIYNSGPAAPFKYLNTRARFELQKRNIVLSSFNYSPIQEGINISSVSHIVNVAGRSKKNLLIWVTDLPKERVNPASLWTIAVYSRYEQNKQLQFINRLFCYDGSEEVPIYHQPAQQSSGVPEEPYRCLLMTETPDQKEIVNYDNILILYTTDNNEIRFLPQRLEQNLQDLKIKPDYDLKVNLGTDSGMWKKQVKTILLRIPVKPAESSLLPEPSPHEDTNRIPQPAPE